MSSIEQSPATGGEPAPGQSGADNAAARGGLAGFETRLLAELQLVVAERAAAGQGTGERAGRESPRRAWLRPAMLTGAFSAALAAGLAVALIVTSTGAGHGPAATHFAPATTVAAVFDNAAAAALREPAIRPRPDQFVYTKAKLAMNEPVTTQTVETWTSVGGMRVGATVTYGPTTRTARGYVTACVNGLVKPPSPITPHCTPRQYAAYKPWLPTTGAGMLAYLKRTSPRDGSVAQSVLEQGFYLLTGADLTPAQQAAMYHALALVPHLTVVPSVTDILGRTGVGIRDHLGPNSSWTVIFSRTTFQPLGLDVEAVGPVYDRQAIAVQATIVNKVGQRP
jgi:hypothetical protein